MDSRAIISVIDNLESTDITAALSANQGRVLKELIDDIDTGNTVNVVNNLTSTSITDALSANQGKILNDKINTLDSEVSASTWSTLTLASGISQYNSTNFPCRFKKQGKIVFVEGAVKGINTSSGVLATLPEGYRPNRPFYYIQSTSGGRINTLKITSSGSIERVNTTNGSMTTDDYHFINTSFIMN